MALSTRLKKMLPVSGIDKLRELRRWTRRADYRLRKSLGLLSDLSKSDLVDTFRSLGIRPGDIVMMHCSLSRLGHIDGGAHTVIEAITEILGADGTLMVPTLSFGGDMYTHFEHYDNADPFDTNRTPSRMGRISETVRTMPGAARSVHPSHSVAALGPMAEYLTKDHHQSSRAFGINSPYYRICEKGGKFMLFGVDFKSFTAIHVIEDIVDDFPFPVHMPGTYEMDVIMPDGSRRTLPFVAHNPEMVHIRDGNSMEPYFFQYGILRDIKLGDGRIMVIDGGRLLPVMQKLLDRGITMYAPRK
jgi:aminoglycoside 3-N-acetyltransferase